MIPLDHPHVCAFLTAARDDLGHACGFADWLQEQGEGLPTLCWWLSRCADADLPAVQAALAAWERGQGREERAGQVREHRIFPALASLGGGRRRRVWLVTPRDHAETYHHQEEEARRDLRRRILALFPEVEVRVEFSISDREFQDIAKGGRAREIQRRLGSAGFHPDRLHAYWDDVSQRRRHFAQVLCAPDLIPADKSEPTPAD